MKKLIVSLLVLLYAGAALSSMPSIRNAASVSPNKQNSAPSAKTRASVPQAAATFKRAL